MAEPDRLISTSAHALLPVGMPLGFFSMTRSSQIGNEVAEIRHGGMRHQLPPDLYEFWTQIARLGSRQGVHDWAAAEQVTNVEGALADLIEVGLVIEVGLSSQHDREVLASHRLLPMGYGLGNTREARTLFHVADQRGEVLHSMSGFSFGVWSLSDGYKSVIHACEASADLFGIELDSALDGFTVELAAMVARGVAVLDVIASVSGAARA